MGPVNEEAKMVEPTLFDVIVGLNQVINEIESNLFGPTPSTSLNQPTPNNNWSLQELRDRLQEYNGRLSLIAHKLSIIGLY